MDGSNVTRVTPVGEEFEGTNSYTLSGDAKFAVYSFSNANRPTLTKIIRLPEHVETTVLACNDDLWTNVKQIDLPAIEYFKVPLITIPLFVELCTLFL